MIIIETNLKKFNVLFAVKGMYYIDNENNLIARLIKDNENEIEFDNFREWYLSTKIDIDGVFDLFEFREEKFVIYSFKRENNGKN